MIPAAHPPTQPLPARLSFRTRLLLGYIVILLVLTLLALVSVTQMERLTASSRELERQTRAAQAAEDLSSSAFELVVVLDESLLLEDPAHISEGIPPLRTRLNEQHAQIQQIWEQTPALDSAIARLDSILDPLLVQVKAGSWELARENRTSRMGEAIQRVREEIDLLVNQATAARIQALADAERTRSEATRYLLAALALTLVAGLLVAVGNLSGLSRQLHILISSANRLASGDLDLRIVPSSRDEIGQLADAFNRMAQQLQALYASLEARISERTARLEATSSQLRASAEVAQAASTILDPQAMLDQVVDLISERFGFYHTGIFLLDVTGRAAALSAASSPGGKRLLARGHLLEAGQGVVGAAILRGEAYVAGDVRLDATYLTNPELPGTHSEAALPLRARGKIIGVLDVQSGETNAFSNETLGVLQTLADQVALVLENARLYQQAQERLDEVRRLYGQNSRQAWHSLIQRRAVSAGVTGERSTGVGYRYTPFSGVRPERADQADLELLREMQEANLDSGAETLPEREDELTLALPLAVRNQVIGVFKVRKPAGSTRWTSAEIEMLTRMVDQLAVALEATRLYDETQHRAERERLVGEVTTQIRETLDIDTVLRTAAQQIRLALGLPEVTVRLAPKNQ